MLASGSANFTTFAGLATALGRITGMVAATMIMVQLLLASRAPFVERVVGHDRALHTHGRLGRIGFVVLLVHAATITIGYAGTRGSGILDEAVTLTLRFGGPMTAAVGGFALLCIVIVTSLALVRSRWRYENWHAVHLLSYAAIVLTIPHQFVNGSTFARSAPAWWYWATLWLVTVGVFVLFRAVRPLWQLARYDLRVASVKRIEGGSTVVVIKGRRLRTLDPLPGQFFLFRFLTRELWDEAHPYSLSRSRNGDFIRITVKPLGDHSAAVAQLPVGTKVAVEGPLGIFHDRTRTGRHLVLAGSGIGVTPILAMLESSEFGPGECTVIIRAHSEADAPHLDEFSRFARARGANLVVLLGPRGVGWAPKDQSVRLRGLVPAIAHADIFACGPEAWVAALAADAEASGVPAHAFHAEKFAW